MKSNQPKTSAEQVVKKEGVHPQPSWSV